MKNLYIFNFRQLPILATYFYNSCNVNKTIILETNDIYVKCKTYYKYINTNKCEGNTFVKSNLEIIYNSTKIEEECIYEDYEISEKLYIKYLFRNYDSNKKIEELKREFSFENNERTMNNNYLYNSCIPNTYTQIIKIKKIIKDNIENIIIKS